MVSYFQNLKYDAPKTVVESPIVKIFKARQSEDDSTSKPRSIKDYKGVAWEAELEDSNPKRTSGTAQQSMVKLTRSDGKGGMIHRQARIKVIENLNEAIVYHNLNQFKSNKKDELSQFMPQFITVLDKYGKEINLTKELAVHGGSIEALCKNEDYKPAYLVIRDLVEHLESQDATEVKKSKIKDIKFVRPSLLGLTSQDLETKLHGYAPKNFVFKAVRSVFFKQTRCSFAFQRTAKFKWYTVVIYNIKRIMTVRKTKAVIRGEFEKLPIDQLIEVRAKVNEIKKAMEKSNYAFLDASLLFLPYQKTVGDGKKVNGLDLRVIDMSHALSRTEIEEKKEKYENISLNCVKAGLGGTAEHKGYLKKIEKMNKELEKFDRMKFDMEHSMTELDSMLAEIMMSRPVYS